MRTYLILIIALTIFSVPSISTAANGRPGPYFSAFLGSSFAKDATITGYEFGTPYSDRASFDAGIYTGATGGYDFGFLRLEGELSYRYAELDTVTFSNGTPLHNVDGELGALATMFNVFFDMHNNSRVTPYLGGGLGFASLHLSDTTAYNGGTKVFLYDDSNDTVLAAQVGGGMDIALNSRYSLDIGYRYFITDKAQFDGNGISSNMRLESHNAMVGFKFKF